MSESFYFRIEPCKTPQDAKTLMEKSALILSGVNGVLLRGLINASDADRPIFWETVDDLREAMLYLSAVELYLINAGMKPPPTLPKPEVET